MLHFETSQSTKPEREAYGSTGELKHWFFHEKMQKQNDVYCGGESMPGYFMWVDFTGLRVRVGWLVGDFCATH